MMNVLLLLKLFLLCFSISCCAEQQAIIELDVKQAKKIEVRYGDIGPRSTLLFYLFKEKKSILRIHIDKKKDKINLDSKIYFFDKMVTDEGMKKWVNNQHSCGVYPDVPKPIKTILMAKDNYTIKSIKTIGENKDVFKNVFIDHEIKLEFSDFTDKVNFKLNSFAVDTKVYEKQ